MPKSHRQIQKEQTHKQIIEAAIHEFAKSGLLNARTQDIAKNAGISHGALFAHFPTRDTLLTAALDEFDFRVNRRLHELVTNQSTIRAVLAAHLQGLEEFEAFYTRLVIEGRLLPEPTRHHLVTIQSAVAFHLIQAFESEVAAGTIRPMPAHLFFNTWMGLIHYYLSNGDLFAPDESVLARYGQILIEHFLNIISP